MNEFWSACLSRLESELPAQQFNAWIKTLRLEEDEQPGQLRLVAPNRYVLDWVRKRYLTEIEAMSREFFPDPIDILLAVEDAPQAKADEPVASSEAIAAPISPRPTGSTSMS